VNFHHSTGIPQVERRTPHPFGAAYAGVPLLLGLGLVVFLVGGAYCLVTLADRFVHHGMAGPHVVPATRLLVAACVGLAAAGWFLWRWVFEVIPQNMATEEHVGMAPPESEPAAPRVLEAHVQAGNSIIYAASRELGIDDERLVRFAVICAGCDGDLSEARWGNDRGTFPDGINTFRAFRTKLVDRRLVERTSTARNAPYILTGPGRAFVARLVEYSHTFTHSQSAEVNPYAPASGGGGMAELPEGE
jgi:hypothetical protein